MPRYLTLLFLLLTVASAQAQEEAAILINSDNANRLEEVAVLGGGFITEPVWSPDGRTIAVAGSLGVWLYEADNLQVPPRLLEGHTREVTSIAFSPDGQFLATGGADGDIRLWTLAAGESRVLFSRVSGRGSTSVAFSPDSRLLAVGGGSLIHLYDLRQQHELPPLEDVCLNFVASLAFSPDGDLLVCGSTSLADFSSGMFGVWSFSSGIIPVEINWMIDANVTFSADGDTLIVWDMDPLRPVTIDWQVRAWDVESRAFVALPDWWSEEAYVPEFSLQTDRVAFSNSGVIEVRDFSSGELLYTKNTGRLQGLAFRPEGRQIAYIDDNVLYTWDLSSNVSVAAPRRHNAAFRQIIFHPDGEQLAYVSDNLNSVGLWSIAQDAASPILERSAELTDVVALAYNADGTQFAAGSDTGDVFIWDTMNGTLVGTLQMDSSGLYALRYDGSARLDILACDAQRFQHNVISSAYPLIDLILPPRCTNIYQAAFGADAYTYIASRRGNNPNVSLNRLESFSEGEQPDSIAESWLVSDLGNDIVVNAEGDQIAVGSGYEGHGGGGVLTSLVVLEPEKEAQHWVTDEDTYNCTSELSIIHGLAFSPDDRLLVAGSGDSLFNGLVVQVWDTQQAEALVTLDGHRQWINDVAFNPQGTVLASASMDGTIRLWAVGDNVAEREPPECPNPNIG